MSNEHRIAIIRKRLEQVDMERTRLIAPSGRRSRAA